MCFDVRILRDPIFMPENMGYFVKCSLINTVNRVIYSVARKSVHSGTLKKGDLWEEW